MVEPGTSPPSSGWLIVPEHPSASLGWRHCFAAARDFALCVCVCMRVCMYKCVHACVVCGSLCRVYTSATFVIKDSCILCYLFLEVRLGEARVSQLEKALEACQSELQGHLSKIEADSVHHEDVVRAYKHQVCV